MITAIIIAGTQSIKGMETDGNKALYLINEKPMVQYLTESLRQAKHVGKIVLVGPSSSFKEIYTRFADEFVDGNEGIMGNIMKGIVHLDSDEYVLICTCDIPLITPVAIDDFIERAMESGGDFCYPIVDKILNDQKYPEMRRTYVKIKEGNYSGGNIFYINPNIVKTNYEFALKLMNYRKKPLKMSALLGYGFLLKLLMGLVTIAVVERKFAKITGINAKAIVSSFPEIGQDVDKVDDLNAAIKYLSVQNT